MTIVSGPAASLAGPACVIWMAKISLRSLPGRNKWQASHTAKFRTLITVGFGRQTLLGAADTLIDLVSREKLRHIFLLGGCDGARGERHYFTDFATSVPDDCLILTLACGKYRFNKLEFGDIEGLPRLVDAGQCNDAYSAIILAVTLAEKLGCGVNDLPLSLVLSGLNRKRLSFC